MEDTSICVTREVDLHVEVDPTIHPGSMMQHDSVGDNMTMSKHMVMRDSSQSHADRCLGRYSFHKDVFKDAFSRQ
jgi:hypothetical protein